MEQVDKTDINNVLIFNARIWAVSYSCNIKYSRDVFSEPALSVLIVFFLTTIDFKIFFGIHRISLLKSQIQ